IDAPRLQAVVSEELQPLAPPAAHVEHGSVGSPGTSLANDGQVDGRPLPDVLAGAPEVILEADVEGIEEMVELLAGRATVGGRRIRAPAAFLEQERDAPLLEDELRAEAAGLRGRLEPCRAVLARGGECLLDRDRTPLGHRAHLGDRLPQTGEMFLERLEPGPV